MPETKVTGLLPKLVDLLELIEYTIGLGHNRFLRDASLGKSDLQTMGLKKMD
jgi:hypothetical protein